MISYLPIFYSILNPHFLKIRKNKKNVCLSSICVASKLIEKLLSKCEFWLCSQIELLLSSPTKALQERTNNIVDAWTVFVYINTFLPVIVYFRSVTKIHIRYPKCRRLEGKGSKTMTFKSIGLE